MNLQNLPQKPGRGILSAGVLAGCLVACASSPQTLETPRPQNAPLVLKVRNENPMDVRVYAIRGTVKTRLGIVSTMRTEYFKIPRSLYRSAGAVQFRVDPVGGAPGYVTEPVLVSGIHQIDLRLEKPFAYSRMLVR
jgi:hypothetical protein